MSKFAKFTLIKFVLPTDTSSEEFCTAYYFLHGSLEGKFSVVRSCNTILIPSHKNRGKFYLEHNFGRYLVKICIVKLMFDYYNLMSNLN